MFHPGQIVKRQIKQIPFVDLQRPSPQNKRQNDHNHPPEHGYRHAAVLLPTRKEPHTAHPVKKDIHGQRQIYAAPDIICQSLGKSFTVGFHPGGGLHKLKGRGKIFPEFFLQRQEFLAHKSRRDSQSDQQSQKELSFVGIQILRPGRSLFCLVRQEASDTGRPAVLCPGCLRLRCGFPPFRSLWHFRVFRIGNLRCLLCRRLVTFKSARHSFRNFLVFFLHFLIYCIQIFISCQKFVHN